MDLLSSYDVDRVKPSYLKDDCHMLDKIPGTFQMNVVMNWRHDSAANSGLSAWRFVVSVLPTVGGTRRAL